MSEFQTVAKWFTVVLGGAMLVLAGIEVGVGAYGLALLSSILAIANWFAYKAVMQSR